MKMAFNKKGTEMIWIVIGLVLGLVVLLVSLALVTGKLQLFGKSTEELEQKTTARLCSEFGGACYAGGCASDTTEKPAPAAGWIDCPSPSNCCVPK